METYWDAFATEYEEVLENIALVEILEAFWYYCNNEKNRANLIMHTKEEA